uniref:WD_REPEATS_REGION domain-containing protein n=2 Tax=Mesocestoides corti TaxID=53468 RepID=A0A5K3FJK9_MESCO
DDHNVNICNLNNSQHTILVSLPESVFPVAIACPPKAVFGTMGKSATCKSFIVSSTDGYFHIINKSGRIEKSFEAHRGAVLGLKWSYDGNSFATCGEDGHIKIWSRSGMLRSTLAKINVSIYGLSWGPRSEHIVHTFGKQLVIRSIRPNNTPIAWMAHEGMVLKVDWNPVNELLISGGEDCKYKVWDSFGHMLYSGQIYDNPISSLSWKPDGQHFIIGSYNSLRLCDKIGWSYNMQKPNIGSLLDVAWSPDGTNVVAVGATGGVLFAHVSECCLECVGFEAVVSSAKTITITNVRDESKDTLEFRDRILRVSLAYEHLIALTTNQCHIYSVNNFNTPIIVDLKDATISLIIQSQE